MQYYAGLIDMDENITSVIFKPFSYGVNKYGFIVKS